MLNLVGLCLGGLAIALGVALIIARGNQRVRSVLGSILTRGRSSIEEGVPSGAVLSVGLLVAALGAVAVTVTLLRVP